MRGNCNFYDYYHYHYCLFIIIVYLLFFRFNLVKHVNLFLENGASVTIRNKKELTPLQCAQVSATLWHKVRENVGVKILQ